jgi:ribosomal protein S18 acetylase RimI-like enzyme
MIRVEETHIRDMGHLTSMEIRAQEFAKTSDDIKKYFMDPYGTGMQAYLARIGGKVVGYALTDFDKDAQTCWITSIGTHPNFRKAGVSRKIVDHVANAAAPSNLIVKMEVASYLIDDKEDPWNIEHWLWKLGFKATGTLENGFTRYGKKWDSYTFERLK